MFEKVIEIKGLVFSDLLFVNNLVLFEGDFIVVVFLVIFDIFNDVLVMIMEEVYVFIVEYEWDYFYLEFVFVGVIFGLDVLRIVVIGDFFILVLVVLFVVFLVFVVLVCFIFMVLIVFG